MADNTNAAARPATSFQTRGPRAEVLTALAAATLPEDAKTFLAGRIQTAPWPGIEVHYHEHPHTVEGLGHWHIKKLY